MKVIFLENVQNVAKAGDIREVSDGYARNFLLPKNLALKATPAAEKIAAARVKTQARLTAEALNTTSQLDGKTITLKANAGAEGKLHGSVTTSDIAEEIKKLAGLEIDKRKIELAEPIHQLGNYEVNIRLAGEAVAKISVVVVEDTEKSAG